MEFSYRFIIRGLSILFVITTKISYGQNNPRTYFDYINNAELAICDSNYQEAVINYKRAFQYLKEPFGNDLLNFLHCGLIIGDTESINICIPKFKKRNYFFPNDWIKDKYKEAYIAIYTDSLYRYCTIESQIDTNYRKFIAELLTIDQNSRTQNSKHILSQDSINIARLKQYIDSTGLFPTESIVGNTLNRATGSITYELLLIHYAYANVASSFQNPISLKLDEKVLLGEFPPDLYAHLCDSRGYGLDGKAINQSPVRYGCNFYIVAKRSDNSDFNILDRNTWQQRLVLPELTKEEEKAIDKRREKMNMEPYQDFLKKIQYQMYSSGAPFRLVDDWFLGVFME